jgi:N-acetyl-gamma-glutamyl-phosphate reductase
MSKTIKVAIVGASGYTGLELMRLLYGHPDAELVSVSSRQYEGKSVAEVFPSLRGALDSLAFVKPEESAASDADAVFLAMPHGAGMELAERAIKAGRKVIDLSADFRIKDAETYKAWYGEHKAPGLLGEAVYGLSELRREAIKKARLIANPGCYPTSAILALAPLLKKGVVKPGSIIIDAKSGTSGAGREASLATSFVEVFGAFKPYNIGRHRHAPEIEQELSAVSGGDVKITFSTHLLPVSRGILSTIYADLTAGFTTSEILSIYRAFYAPEPFVRVLDEGSFPDVKHVRGSNFCDIGVSFDARLGRVTVMSAIDNLVKGASGQAVQNMNIAFGLDEGTGLEALPMQV